MVLVPLLTLEADLLLRRLPVVLTLEADLLLRRLLLLRLRTYIYHVSVDRPPEAVGRSTTSQTSGALSLDIRAAGALLLSVAGIALTL